MTITGMKTFVMLFILGICIWQVPKFCHSKTDGFTLPKISSTLTYDQRWETPFPNPDELASIFKQRFTYLKAGGQSYVFASEDGRYVIKFFKHYRMRLLPLIAKVPLPKKLYALREKQRAKRQRKLLRDFTSYKLAYDLLKDETALVCVHLNKGKASPLSVTIVDRLNIAHTLDLSRYEFVLQKKAFLAYPYLEKLVKEGQIEKAKEALDSFCSLIVRRCSLGVYDEDAKVHRNVGFIDNQAIIIDVGRLKPDESRKDPAVQERDLKKIVAPLLEFLEPLSAELATYLKDYGT